MRTLDRVVSLTDFEDFARTFSGIGKARADWLWAGSQRLVHVTVAGPDGADVSPKVLEQPDRRGRPRASAASAGTDLAIRAALLRAHGQARDQSDDYEEDTVLAAAEARPSRRILVRARGEFAERVATSDVIATWSAWKVSIAVDLDALTYEVTNGGNTADDFGLPALGARFDQLTRDGPARATPHRSRRGPLDLRVMA